MPKSSRSWQPDQTALLPPCPREWFADDNQVFATLVQSFLDDLLTLVPEDLGVMILFMG